MLERTRRLWEQQHRLAGDRRQLFGAVAGGIEATTVLYPGSYVDVTPAVVWPSVTFVDVDRRARRFFEDAEGVRDVLRDRGADPDVHTVRFLHADYREPLDLVDGSFDLLISLYAGFVSEHCTRYLRVGGSLLVNPSHGDVAMASIDPRYRLRAVVVSSGGRWSVTSKDLGTHLVPTREVEVTREALHASGRGIAYTKRPFAYLFERIS